MTYVRNSWTTQTMPQQQTLGAVPNEQELFRQVHAWAIAINQNQQYAVQQAAAGNATAARNAIEQVAVLRDYMAKAVQQWRAASENADPARLTVFDQSLLALGTWVSESLRALPGVIAAVPNAVIDGLAQVSGRVLWSGVKLSVPLVVLGLVAIGLVTRAERTRTYRRHVA